MRIGTTRLKSLKLTWVSVRTEEPQLNLRRTAGVRRANRNEP